MTYIIRYLLVTVLFLLTTTLTFSQSKFPKDNYWYQLKSVESKKYVSTNHSKKPGTPMKAKASPGASGIWKFYHNEDGLVKIRNRESGMYLSNLGSGDADVHICQRKVPSEGSWWEVKSNGHGLYYLINKMTGMYLAIQGVHENSFIIQTKQPSTFAKWDLIEKGVIQKK